MGVTAASLRAFPEKPVTQEQSDQLQALLTRSLQGEPIAYLTGEQGFWDLVLKVNEHTLIPRPETELLVQYLLDKWDLTTSKKIVDLGTGSGAIALALAKARPKWQIWGVDQSAAALEVAQTNAQALQLNNVQWLQSDWFSALEGMQFDAIVSNPPYIAEDEPHPSLGDLRFEPIAALVSGKTGLESLQCLIQEGAQYLYPQGLLLLEHGFRQQPAVIDLLKAHGWQDVEGFKDLAGWPRMCVASGCWLSCQPSPTGRRDGIQSNSIDDY